MEMTSTEVWWEEDGVGEEEAGHEVRYVICSTVDSASGPAATWVWSSPTTRG